ncbi:MAG: porin PorA family protein [Chloroflexota bacterium]
MNNKLLGGILAFLGVAMVVIGLVLMLVIVPGIKVFPEDVDTTRTFDMTFLTLLDAESLEFANYPEGEDHALRINRNIRVEAVEGNTTLIREEQTILDGETPLVQQIKHYALDRQSLIPVTEYPEDWAENEGFWMREGQVIGWPIGVEERDYDGWNDDTRATVDLEFQERQEHEGIQTYFYTAAADPQRITDAHAEVLGLPASLTTMQLAQLASGVDVEGVELSTPARLRLIQTLGQAVEEVVGEGSDIPLEYYYDYVGEYWIEPTTGVLIDTTKYEHRAATFPQAVRDRFAEILTEAEQDPEANNYVPPDILDALLPITVNAFYYEMSEESVQGAIDDATGSRDQIVLFGSTLPLILILGGVLIGGTGGFIFARRR